MRYLPVLLVAAAVAVAGVVTAVALGGNKVTICHAAGQEGTTKYVTLTISENAVYGPGGHFNENGTPQAGHEQDYFGACEGDTTDTTPTDTTPTDTTPTTPTETTPTTPSGERCPPGMTPTAGKDGEEGNDECEFPPSEMTPPAATVPPVATVPPAVVTPPTTTTAPPVTTTPPTAKPSVKPKPVAKPKVKAKSTVVVKVSKKPNGVVKITTSDGKTHTGIMGSG